jgi:homoserine kinase
MAAARPPRAPHGLRAPDGGRTARGSPVTGGAVHVRVPATSANLGPGFDALGLALSLHDDVEARITSHGLRIEVDGEGADQNLADAGEKHLVVQAMRAAFDTFAAGKAGKPPGLALRCTNRIPHGRGLGSSAAAIVAGILAAVALAEVSPPAQADLLALATRIEGHPDNVAACLAGGLTIAWTTTDGTPRLTRLEPAVKPVAIIAPPEVSVRTEVARAALPATVPHRDAAANAGRAALLIAALTHNGNLYDATEDWLHQRYRAKAMPDSYALVQALRGAGIAAVVSGAGPSLLAIFAQDSRCDLDSLGSIVRETGKAWRISPLDVEPQGARLLRPDIGGFHGTDTPSLRDTDGCEGMP